MVSSLRVNVRWSFMAPTVMTRGSFPGAVVFRTIRAIAIIPAAVACRGHHYDTRRPGFSTAGRAESRV